MKLFRVGSTNRDWRPEDISGAGAAKWPGRWNQVGQPVLYTATSIALAVLETSARVDPAGWPTNRFVVTIELPPRMWQARQIVALDELPGGWDSIPAGAVSVEIGASWLASNSSALLQVPSVIVPEEPVILINCKHPDTKAITPKATRRLNYATQFRQAP